MTEKPSVNRVNKWFAVMITVIVAVSVAAIVVSLVASSLGVHADASSNTFWMTVFTIPLVGFPIAILLIIAFMISVAVRRSRQVRS
jgi:uncharacterized membrane protein YhaH (DUF805 family)